MASRPTPSAATREDASLSTTSRPCGRIAQNRQRNHAGPDGHEFNAQRDAEEAFSLPTTSAMPSAFVFLTSASSSVIFRPASISATASAVSCIFWRPAFSRPME